MFPILISFFVIFSCTDIIANVDGGNLVVRCDMDRESRALPQRWYPTFYTCKYVVRSYVCDVFMRTSTKYFYRISKNTVILNLSDTTKIKNRKENML
jgi:hypothetical protein